MRRRAFIAFFGGAAVLAAHGARAQQPAMPVVGFLGSASNTFPHVVDGFRQGLKEAGYVEGRNVAIEFRWAEGQYERLPAMAVDLLQRHVAVIFAQAPPSAMAAKAATSTIPIVFSSGGDPVKSGLVASLGRPGGNITGVTFLVSALVPKRLELLRELLPKAATVALLVNPTSANAEPDTREMEAAMRDLALRLVVVRASTEREIDMAFAGIAEKRADALVIGADPFFLSRPDQLVALASRYAVPVSYFWREFVDAGGLMSYGTSLSDAYRQAGIYCGRILNGEKAADLPILQPTKFELVVNLKTAKALGIAIPQSILLRADEVIE